VATDSDKSSGGPPKNRTEEGVALVAELIEALTAIGNYVTAANHIFGAEPRPTQETLGEALAKSLAQLRRFEHFKGSKCLRLLRWTPEGRHYSGVAGAGARAVILGGGWAGRSSFSFFSKRLSSGSGSV